MPDLSIVWSSLMERLGWFGTALVLVYAQLLSLLVLAIVVTSARQVVRRRRQRRAARVLETARLQRIEREAYDERRRATRGSAA